MKASLTLAAWSLAAVLAGVTPQALAGEGHDHGDAPAPVAGPALPRFTAVSELFELVGVLVVGTLSLMHPELFLHDATVWSGYGFGYFWVPLALPFVGLWWLRSSGRTSDEATDAGALATGRSSW